MNTYITIIIMTYLNGLLMVINFMSLERRYKQFLLYFNYNFCPNGISIKKGS